MEQTARATYLNPPGTCPAQGLYSHVTRVSGGTLYFVAGQLAVGSDGTVVGVGDFDAQFARVFENMSDVLKGIGCQFIDVAKFTTYMVHSQDIPAFMRCRQALFPKIFGSNRFPPNTLLIIDRLVKEEFLIEVEAVAVGP